MKNDDIVIYPSDYEPCGECGYDHGYEYEEAHKWHSANDERRELALGLQEHPPEVLSKIFGGCK